MAVIDIGAAATDRGDKWTIASTIIEGSNPANDTGRITSVEIWLFTAETGVEVATFIDEGSNVLSTRDSEALGAVASGSKQTFAGLDMDVVTGDYLGVYGSGLSGGEIERDGAAGVGYWLLAGDQIPSSSVTFGWYTPRVISLYGTGTTVVVHEKEITEGIALGETLVKQPIKIVSEGVALSEVLTKVITKAPFVEGIAVGEVVEKVYIHCRTIIEGIAIGETVTKAVTKVISEGIAVGESLCKIRIIRAIRNQLAVRAQTAARIVEKIRCLCKEE